jgi:GNAT superfamily N-acetyltransferase
MSVDPTLLHAWLAARSVARGVPAPVPDRGGWRVDTGTPAEAKRWVFAGITPGLVDLAHSLDVPRHPIKACVSCDELRTVTPPRWVVEAPTFFMATEGDWADQPLPAGYTLHVARRGPVTEATILAASGEPAARGFAAETADAFVYDRIATTPAHRRRGLGRAVLTALAAARRDTSVPQLLVATQEGRALYLALGWRTFWPYSTAAISLR